MEKRYPIFKIKGLTKVYTMGEVQIHALRGVDLKLYPGELIVLLGASGSGKSTLINIIGGLDSATEGDVYFNENRLSFANNRQMTRFRREHIGFVFQFYNLIPSLTALENVSIVTEICSDPMDPGDALSMVGLKDRLHHFPAQMSGGEQQRVAIARAIAKKPTVLMCDEPTGALDSRTGIKVLDVIQQVNAGIGTTTVVITHNEVIGKMAHRIVRISDGRISGIITNEHRASPEELEW
ncbi:ABC transporter ATP-binding protein [Desulfonatronovibrio magnus]|uniref:ABC transporter ATP-binding protein n=1 Tax=Desulfonatronovibrio magnus TaxID=698827 RepID=UPI0005EBDCFC|nr:ABC transporter ATP-binding protein [Desulfonatronovibrio magnus]